MLDQSIVALAKAIRQHESGGNFTIKGKSGESGAYQFMPATWKTWAKQYLGTSNAAMTPENQNQVAYRRIAEWKTQGYNPAQIASLWNSGKPKWEGKVGVNKYGVRYNVPAYVKNVYSLYQRFKNVA